MMAPWYTFLPCYITKLPTWNIVPLGNQCVKGVKGLPWDETHVANGPHILISQAEGSRVYALQK